MLPVSLLLGLSLVAVGQGAVFTNSSSPYTSETSKSSSSSAQSVSSISITSSSSSSISSSISSSTSSSTSSSVSSSSRSTSSSSGSSISSSATSSGNSISSSGSSISTSGSVSSTSSSKSSSLSSSSSSYTGSCNASCFVSATPPATIFWYPYTFTETIIAATLVVIVNTVYNTTKTSLRLNEIPSGYVLPDVNAGGTHVTTVTYTRSGKVITTDLAFPTRFLRWPDGYQWSGTLETSGKCETAVPESKSVALPSFPQLPLVMPTHPLGYDPEGVLFKPTLEPGFITEYKESFLGESAWQSCVLPPEVAPFVAPFTARFMTATTTEYEKVTNPPAPASKPDVPGASETPPPNPPDPAASKLADVKPAEQPGQSQAPAQPQPGQSQQPEASNGNNPPAPTAGNQPGVSEPPANPQVTQAIPVGSETVLYSAGQSETAVVLPNGQTLQPGSTLTVDGTPIYLPTSGSAIVVGDATVTFNPAGPTAPSYITIGSETVPLSFAPGQTGIKLPNGVTLLPGSSTTVDGTVYSLAPSGTAIVVDGSSIPLNANTASYIVVGTNTIPISPVTTSGGGLVLPNGVTLLPGSSTTVSGTVYSLSPSGTAIIVDGSSIPLNPNTGSYIVIGSETIPISPVTAPGGGVVLPNGVTLYPGSSVTISGTVISLAPSGTALIIDGTTVPLSNTALPTGFSYVTASNGGVILPNGQTLLRGSSTTISGTTFSLGPSGGALVVISGTSAMTVTPGRTGSSGSARSTSGSTRSTTEVASFQGPGHYIWSGLGGGPTFQTAGALGVRSDLHIWVAVVFIGVGAAMILL